MIESGGSSGFTQNLMVAVQFPSQEAIILCILPGVPKAIIFAALVAESKTGAVLLSVAFSVVSFFQYRKTRYYYRQS